MHTSIRQGEKLPFADLGAFEAGEVHTVNTGELFGRSRAIVVGLPGAWTPVCTRNHVPRFVELAPSLLLSGFDFIACIAANNPWTLAEWSGRLDPERRLRFLSDGNLDFGKATGLTTHVPEWFLGSCLQRFVMIVNHGVVEKISVERSPFEVSCTSADECVIGSQPIQRV